MLFYIVMFLFVLTIDRLLLFAARSTLFAVVTALGRHVLVAVREVYCFVVAVLFGCRH